MTAIKKEELARLEEEHGLSAEGLSYQHRCSRITAVLKGEEWEVPEPKTKHRVQIFKGTDQVPMQEAPAKSKLYGKRLLLTPMMVPDAKRNLAFDEVIGHDIKVRDASAGEMIYGSSEDVDRMVGDYVMEHEDKNKPVIAKTTFPKVGTEISWVLGKELCPIVRGNDGSKGYLWSFPTSVMQVEDTMIQVYGLKTLITMVWPELLPKFSGKPIMSYIDSITLVASIPLTDALLKEHRRKELLDGRAGLV